MIVLSLQHIAEYRTVKSFFGTGIEMNLDFPLMPSDNALRQRAWPFLIDEANLYWKLWRVLACLGIVWRWWGKRRQSLLLPSLSWLQPGAAS